MIDSVQKANEFPEDKFHVIPELQKQTLLTVVLEPILKGKEKLSVKFGDGRLRGEHTSTFISKLSLLRD